MSQNKRKPREIHVDKLIIKADHVVLENEERPERRRDRDDIERDPWGFPIRPMPESADRDRGDEKKADNDDDKDDRDREDRRGSWF
ncbi:MAG TPA: hypothetical protein VFK37_02365 [Bacillales bacterium]|nr:hypothetical protein [Bacillales bacterium]